MISKPRFLLLLLLGAGCGEPIDGEYESIADSPDFSFLSPNGKREALLRFEDVGPAASWMTAANQAKFRRMASYLQSEGVPFHISMIPHYKNATEDRAVSDASAASFVSLMNDLRSSYGASIGMHGHTHQFGPVDAMDQTTFSGAGSEFSDYCAPVGVGSCCNPATDPNCAPQDNSNAFNSATTFLATHTSSRLKDGFDEVAAANIDVDFWSTPHYTSVGLTEDVLQAWAGLIFEDHSGPQAKRRYVNTESTRFNSGAIYVPTPLGYIEGGTLTSERAQITAKCGTLGTYGNDDLAGIFYHPYLELQFMTVNGSNVVTSYDTDSHLHRIVNCIKAANFDFVSIVNQTPFVPSSRHVDYFDPMIATKIFAGDINGDGRSEILDWDEGTGDWTATFVDLGSSVRRYYGPWTRTIPLQGWAGPASAYDIVVGDWNGDHKDDLAAVYKSNGQIQVALSNGTLFIPTNDAASNTVWVTLAAGTKVMVGDVNADEKEDLITWKSSTGQWQVAISTGTDFLAPATWRSSWAIGSGWTAHAGDFNGDQQVDVIVRDVAAGDWQVALSNSSGFVPNAGPGSWIWLDNWGAGSSWEPWVGDFNGDEIADLMVVSRSTGEWKVAISASDQFDAFSKTLVPWIADSAMVPLVGYFANDGRASIAAGRPNHADRSMDFAVSMIR